MVECGKPTLHPQPALNKACGHYFCCSLGQSSIFSIAAHSLGFITLFWGAWALALKRQSETLRCPRARFPNSRIINWKSRGNVIQFFSSLNRLHISSSQEAQRLGHFKAQPRALVRQLARRRISFSRLTLAVNGGVCIVRPWNRLIKSFEAAWCGLNASLPESVGL